ncbi:MAG: SIMPL domain-containing protein [Patescibacteria group bacterium]|nr:SIMPL domain-containing protein [Patescibacteria group bacterium]
MENKKLILFGVILGISLIIGTSIIAWSLITIKAAQDQITVSGSARQRVTSDSVKWTGSFSRIIAQSGTKDGYAQMKKDENAVRKFLADNGIKAEEINIYPVMMQENYNYNSNNSNLPKLYTLSQTVEVRSSDVNKIKNLAANIQPLVDQNVFFSTTALEYYYTKLAEMRISMLPDAIKDAKARADKIAEGSGKIIKSIKTVDMGVVQVLSPNSVDISDYGSYDTSSIDKEIMITVKVVFNLK